MDIQEYTTYMKNIQANLLSFLENDENDLHHLIDFLKEQKIQTQFLKEFLHLISNISENHRKTTNFIEKIERILLFFKDDITNKISNNSLFNIFKNNKRILLFLFEEKIVTINQYIYTTLKKRRDMICYFEPEIVSYFMQNEKKIEPSFEKNRKRGENHNYISQLIINDSVQEFISYVNKENLSLTQTKIEPSIFETNSFLNEAKDDISLIKYAAFFGSIQIFRYLLNCGVKLTSSLWIWIIHSNHPDLIHLLEENHVSPSDETYNDCFLESIKCFHNNIAIYIQENHLQKKDYMGYFDYNDFFASYNFDFLPVLELINDIDYMFYCFSIYDYFAIINCMINNIDLSKIVMGILNNKISENIILYRS